MHVSAKVDYGIRAAIELASRSMGEGGLVTTERLSEAQEIPRQFLSSILGELRRAGVIESKRGVDGGHRLARPASEITLADVIRAIDGPMATVAGVSPDRLTFDGAAAPMREVWVAVRGALRSVLEVTSLESVVGNDLPAVVGDLIAAPGAWERR